MYKYLLSVTASIFIYSISATAFSQTLLGQPQPPATPAKPQAFSVEQYQKGVQALDKKNQSNFKQRINKLANPVPSFPGKLNSNATPMTAPNSLTPVGQPPSSIPEMPVAQPPAPQTPPYTGFQGTGTNTPAALPSMNSTPSNSGTSSGASSGWGGSIKY